MQQLSLFESGDCQRWQERRQSWRHTSEGGFDPRRYAVREISETDARAFVTRHHYSTAYPAARLRYGLIEDGRRLVGAVVLGVPMSAAVLTRPFPTLEPYRQALELSRLVLLDEVPANTARKNDPSMKGPAWRSVCTIATGSRAEMRSMLAAAGGMSWSGREYGIMRAWARHAGDVFPSTEEFLVAAPAGITNKERAGFATLWASVATCESETLLDLVEA